MPTAPVTTSMKTPPQIVSRFAALFEGYSRAFGQYRITGRKESGKADGKAWTVPESAKEMHWRAHLDGEGTGIGSIPLRDDDTVLWGAIDIDKYTIDHEAVFEAVKERNLPLVVCTTKSAGVHLYVFLTEPASAKMMRSWLERQAALLGYGGSEIFPKQATRTGPRDLGNWINLPYQGRTNVMEAVGIEPPAAVFEGHRLTLEEFVDYAEKCKINPSELSSTKELTSEEFSDGPPCLQHIFSVGGFPDGTRNEGLFSVGVYCKLRNPDGWQADLQKFNQSMSNPPMEPGNLNDLVKSLGKKDYAYKCNKSPLAQHCNRRLCTQRQFGVGQTVEGSGVEIVHITKYPAEPVLWCVEIDGQRIEMNTPTLFSHPAFAKKCMDAISRCPPPVNPSRWQQYLDEKLKSADEVPPPEDASEKGQFEMFIDAWLSGRTMATSKDEMLLDKPFRQDGKTYFLSSSLRKRLDQERFPYQSMHHVWSLLKSLGADKTQFGFKGGKVLNVWYIEGFGMTEEAIKKDEEEVPF